MKLLLTTTPSEAIVRNSLWFYDNNVIITLTLILQINCYMKKVVRDEVFIRNETGRIIILVMELF